MLDECMDGWMRGRREEKRGRKDLTDTLCIFTFALRIQTETFTSSKPL